MTREAVAKKSRGLPEWNSGVGEKKEQNVLPGCGFMNENDGLGSPILHTGKNTPSRDFYIL